MAGGRPFARNWPVLFVTTVRFRSVCGSTTLTVTPGRTAPEESVTDPVISPDEPTPCAWAIQVANRHTRTHASDFIGFSSWRNRTSPATILSKPTWAYSP